MSNRTTKRLGWLPDLPDQRDLLLSPDTATLPAKVDLRPQDLAPIYDQGDLGSCTANAIAAGLRFTLCKQGLPDVDPSRLYIYFKEREKEGTVSEDSGAMIRDGLKVVAKGFVPESDWPYDISTFATPPKPEAELDAEASRDRVIKYMRVPRDIGMRSCLAAGYPFVFGISVYESFESALNGVIPLPEASEKLLGGHALICVGYEDATQRYIFRNSWGQSWGQSGYGSIPYSYLHRSNLASDFWSIRLETEA